jgi:beta-N-acetylhexosaminidase
MMTSHRGSELEEAMAMDVLGVGLSGTTLTDLERTILRDAPPYAIVLFGRNIQSDEQLSGLVAEIKSLSSRPPLIMIDEEGGRVDRLRNLVPGLPSAESIGEGRDAERMAEWLGRVIGLALRYFDIEVNLAPVVDIRGTEPPKGLERRCFGSDAERVVRLAGAFMRGQESAGAASCLKHFPGIGSGTADPHFGATIIDLSLEELERTDLVPFRRLGNAAGAIMIGHGTYPRIDDSSVPATFSRHIAADLLRSTIGFGGIAISDDMEMHAVSDLGSYEEISARALVAGNDIVLFCGQIERVPDLHRFLLEKAGSDPELARRLANAARRAQGYREHCARLRRAGQPPLASFEAVKDEAKRFCAALVPSS